MAKPITIKITGDSKGLNSALGGAESRLGSFGAKAGKVMAGFGLAAGTAVVAAGVGLFKMGSDFDALKDKIIVGTGASGDALDGLMDSAKTVAGNTAASFDDVGTAIADLNTRTGLAGKPLEDLSKQFLDLSRMTGEDLQSSITNVTRAFVDAGVPAEEMSGAMDTLFVASQNTGIEVSRLADQMVKYGAPMRQFGFSFEESAALLGGFEKAGVNAELVMGSLRQALGKLAKEGEDPVETLERVSEQIKSAGSASEANALAIELFGARAGPDMAAAIREGRFEIDELVGTLENSEGAIASTSEATESIGEKFTKFKNRMFVALEPVATLIFDKVGKAFERVAPYIEKFAADAAVWIEEVFIPAVQDMQPTLERVWEIIIEVARVITEVLGAAFTWFSEEAWPVLQEVFQTLVTVIGEVVAFVQENWPLMQEAIQAFMDWFVENVYPVIEEAILLVIAIFERIAQITVDTWEKIRVAIDVAVAAIMFIWDNFGEQIMAAVELVWNYMKGMIEAALKVIQGIIKTVTSLIKGDWSGVWEGIKSILSGVWEGIKTIVSTAIGAVKTLISTGLQAVKTTFTTIWDAVKGYVSEVWEAISGFVSGGIDAIVDFITGLPGRIADAASTAFDGLTDAFKGAVNFIIRGWNSIEFKIPGFKIGPVGYDGFTLGLPDIPLLANGGVISAPTLAMIGEDSRTTPEIVTPERLMRQIVREEGGRGPVTIEQHFHGFSTDEARRLAHEGTEEALMTLQRKVTRING